MFDTRKINILRIDESFNKFNYLYGLFNYPSTGTGGGHRCHNAIVGYRKNDTLFEDIIKPTVLENHFTSSNKIYYKADRIGGDFLVRRASVILDVPKNLVEKIDAYGLNRVVLPFDNPFKTMDDREIEELLYLEGYSFTIYNCMFERVHGRRDVIEHPTSSFFIRDESFPAYKLKYQ